MAKVAVVDDDPVFLEALRSALVRHEVVLIDTPIGASLTIADEQPKLVIVDLNMASLSGEHVVRSLKKSQRTKHIPVLLLSSADEKELQEATERCEAAGYIHKGDWMNLLDQLDDWI